MTLDKDIIYLKHVLECIATIETYVAGGAKIFFDNVMIKDATLRQLQTMAESTMRISQAVKEKLPAVDWKKLAAFRHILVHDYLGDIDPELVWAHIEHRPPELNRQ